MSTEMSRIKETANAHMRRDLEQSEHWTCPCEACIGIRSLMGMDKVLSVRPLVRELEQLEDQLADLADGAEKAAVQAQYLKMYDRLAAVMEK